MESQVKSHKAQLDLMDLMDLMGRGGEEFAVAEVENWMKIEERMNIGLKKHMMLLAIGS